MVSITDRVQRSVELMLWNSLGDSWSGKTDWQTPASSCCSNRGNNRICSFNTPMKPDSCSFSLSDSQAHILYVISVEQSLEGGREGGKRRRAGGPRCNLGRLSAMSQCGSMSWAHRGKTLSSPNSSSSPFVRPCSGLMTDLPRWTHSPHGPDAVVIHANLWYRTVYPVIRFTSQNSCITLWILNTIHGLHARLWGSCLL